ncbi:hypothetical protein N7533_006566 [Penicillium manginii]|uniref:uncharacterized protein n=1 Tax=Penicillium manginii TaxID=203109 RepID=UPI002549A421|nr:uncharacterized protein N7533_006566 [Penicillium manginii]KAJ5749538.1 hypothetical protein N7533_006566 [Penicillium manginii]
MARDASDNFLRQQYLRSLRFTGSERTLSPVQGLSNELKRLKEIVRVVKEDLDGEGLDGKGLEESMAVGNLEEGMVVGDLEEGMVVGDLDGEVDGKEN